MKQNSAYIQYFLAVPWRRIVLFVAMFLLFAEIFQLFMPYSWIFLNLDNLAALILSASVIEISRFQSKWYAFGIYFDSQALVNISIGLLLALLFYASYTALACIAGVAIELSNSFILIEILKFGIMMLVTASVEEFAFRGILLQSLVEKYGSVGPVIILSALFSVAHIFNPNIDNLSLLNIFLVGIVLSIMYLKTKTLWLSISFHFFWNFIQAGVLGIRVSGMNFEYSIFSIDASKLNPAIFGNSFGAESGILTTLFLIIFIPIVINCAPKNVITAQLLSKRKFGEQRLKYWKKK